MSESRWPTVVGALLAVLLVPGVTVVALFVWVWNVVKRTR